MVRITRHGARAGAALLGLLLVLSACSAGADSAKKTDAPKDETFYIAPDDLSDYGPGDLIWARDYDGPHAIDGATNSLVLYTQKAHDGSGLTGVSGIVSIPEGQAPEGGWPVVSWAHGSTGMADRCAPSHDMQEPELNFVNDEFVARWIDKGYAVVRADYEGLGTPGPHPYLIGPSAGRSVLNIVTAAQDLDPDVSNDVVLVGHSQGGHAALWAASMTEVARGLDVKGVVSFAPPTHLAGALEAVLGGMAKAPSGIIAVVLRGLEIDTPSEVDPSTVLLPAGLEKYPLIDEACWAELFEPAIFGDLPVEEFGDQDADMTLVKGKLNANDPVFRNIDVPIFLAQGHNDTTVPSIMTNFLAEEYEAKGFDLTYKYYQEADHNTVLAVANKEANAFIDRVLAR